MRVFDRFENATEANDAFCQFCKRMKCAVCPYLKGPEPCEVKWLYDRVNKQPGVQIEGAAAAGKE